MEALDFWGNKLEIGDKVIFMQKEYRNFLKGVIRSMSNKTALVEHEKTNVNDIYTRQFYGQLIKIK